jgi:hypothetical protein
MIFITNDWIQSSRFFFELIPGIGVTGHRSNEEKAHDFKIHRGRVDSEMFLPDTPILRHADTRFTIHLSRVKLISIFKLEEGLWLDIQNGPISNGEREPRTR